MQVRGASENNLRNIDVDIPRDALVAFTGVSGSGKSSLAFATIYGEAQRRYFESVAPYARRLIRQVGTPQVRSITGLPPAVALAQSRGSFNSRSTVGTLTTVSSTLRLLYSRCGSYPRGVRQRLDAESFSPNTPQGACPACEGQGLVHTVTESAMVPDPSLSIREGAIAAWPGAWQGKNLRDIVIALGIDVDRPWNKLPRAKRDWLLYTDEQPIVLVRPGAERNEFEYNGKFVSARRHILSTVASSGSERMRQKAMRFVSSGRCPTCHGSRLKAEALAVRFAGRSIAELGGMSLQELVGVLKPTAGLKGAKAAVEGVHSGERTEVAVLLCQDLVARLQSLVDLGMGHLSLDRDAPSLSSGEIQRLRLATALRSGLFVVVYVLDEPCAGLHPADALPLYEVLEQLKQSGNSLFVVEHSMDLVRRADWIVDVGPSAGELGGRVLYSGPVAGLRKVKSSSTRPYLFQATRSKVDRPLRSPKDWLELKQVTYNNLHSFDVRFPLGTLTTVTGVSGSGKSTLVSQILVGSLMQRLGQQISSDDGPHRSELDAAISQAELLGEQMIQRVISIDQKPIGRTPRSNPATYTGLFDLVRQRFSQTAAAKRRGLNAGHFSFNVPGGRCETCQGGGFVSVELVFLPSTYSPCPTCHGKRFEAETLKIRLRGKNVADVLAMTVLQASEYFKHDAAILKSLSALESVGLGYLRLGQSAPELSGGEAQRIKLASELQRARRGHNLYVLDEPTASLHPADTEKLMKELQHLVNVGHTVILVEHDLSVIAAADWVIDLGPGGGKNGGKIVCAGTPQHIARARNSQTGKHLARHIAGEG